MASLLWQKIKVTGDSYKIQGNGMMEAEAQLKYVQE